MRELKPIFSQGRWIILCWLPIFWLLSCQPKKETDTSVEGIQSSNVNVKVEIEHAIGFDIIDHQNWKELQLYRHYNDFVDTVKLALVTSGNVPDTFEEHQIIQTPVEHVGALSTTHLSMFELLDALDQLKAVETSKYIYSQKVNERVSSGQIVELAPNGQLNLEATLVSGIDLLMGVGYPNAQNDNYQSLQRTGLPVILNADWQEKTLLGRAEWIKLLGVLLGKEAQANSVFSTIEMSYQQTLDLVRKNVTDGPSVITGLAEGDSWYVAGGNSFANHILSVAQVNYPWSDTDNTGSIRLDFETVYEEGLSADFWLVPSTAKTLKEIIQADPRYADFKAYKEKQIYNIYARYHPGGGNDYYESAVMAPHVVLKDAVKIFHPNLLPYHELVYYNRLQ